MPARYSRALRETPPIIVAEALVDVPDPVVTGLDPGPARPARVVVDGLTHSLVPIELSVTAPAWLRLDQVAPFRRLLATLQHHHGAMLADPVGSGKSYIALAVAQHLAPRVPAVALVPAALMHQWRTTATRLGVPVQIHSHERLSRGCLPATPSSLVIVDESHHFRNPDIRRYRELAPWLVGRRVLLLSATPVVNRLGDLAQQLLLGVADDTLALAGVPSLRTALSGGTVPTAIGHLIAARRAPVDRPTATAQLLWWSPMVGGDALLERIDRLALSPDRGVAALIRMTLWRALGSSGFAARRALERYLTLLEHARHAQVGGCTVSRRAIRRFTTAGLDQLVLWPLLPEEGNADLLTEDIPALQELLAALRQWCDPRLEALARLLRDGRPTIVFTGSRDTLTALRQLDLGAASAWITGERAGLGHTAVPRGTVLEWFRPGASAAPQRLPSVLLATDVAAEGLDLQRAERVVHADLPWTSVRLDQREGRAVRLGGVRTGVDVVGVAPWPALERRLAQHPRLRHKRQLGTRAGLDDAGAWLYRWRSDLPSLAAPGHRGVAVVPGPEAGWLVGLTIDVAQPDGTIQPRSADLLWLGDDGQEWDDPQRALALLALARLSDDTCGVDPPDLDALRRRLAPLVRGRLQAGLTSQWQAAALPGAPRRLGRQLRRLARDAADRRDQVLMELTEAAIGWLGGGHTAGESALVTRLAGLSVPQLRHELRHLRLAPRPRPVGVPRLTGVVRFIIPP